MLPLALSFATPMPMHSELLAGLNPLDWVLVLLVASSTFLALLRGLIRSLISLAGIVLGILLAAWYAPMLAVRLLRWIPQPAFAEIAAFLAIVAGAYLVAALLGRVLRGACQAVGLGLLDRLGGAAFGFARAVLLLAALLVPAAPFLPLLPFARDSVLLPYLRTAAHGVSFVVPQDFGDRLAAGARLLHAPASAGAARSPGRAHRRIQTDAPVEGEAQ